MTLRALHLAAGLTLPLETVTQSLALLAKRRAGKSFTARRLAEQLIRAGQQVVIVDPKGDHWGIRSARDGRSPGLPVTILGGERGDVPLEVGAGELVAKLVAEDRVTALLDLSLFRKHEIATFMTAFLENLYRLKAREQYRTPMMLILDEADAIAPQRPQRGEERMLGAAEDIVRRGGQRGLGCTLITQRSAVLNKNVLTQVQILIALRTIAPQDLAALNAWIDVHGTPEQRKTLMESLPALPVGEAWIWSPGWPTVAGIFQRAHISPIETYDSGATPKPGEKRVEPRHLADVDLGALRKQMAATLERAKADDPRQLRARVAELEARIAELERELAKKAISAPPPTKTEPREVPVLRNGDLERLERLRSGYATLVDRLDKAAMATNERLVALDARLALVGRDNRPPLGTGEELREIDRPALLREVRRQPLPPTPASAGRPAQLAGGERRILTTLAQYPAGRTLRQVALIAGYAVSGGGFNNYIGSLRSRGLLEGGRDALRITGPGRETLGAMEPLPRGRELLDYWLRQLGKAERMVLSGLAGAYPRGLTKNQVAAAAGYAADGGGFNNALGRLRTLELIEGRGELRASAELFE